MAGDANGTFSDFLRALVGYHEATETPNLQPPLEYWWLLGNPSEYPGCKSVGIYRESGLGVHVRSSPDRRIPVYTGKPRAEAAAAEMQRRTGARSSLQVVRIRCLGCYLTGITHERGGEAFRGGALLNDQWPVNFYTCDESPRGSGARHFHLVDSDGRHHVLVGCAETYGPIWVPPQWLHLNSEWQHPPCHPRPW